MNLTPNQLQALDIENHICVTAGAGSGKTTVLVDRYLNILNLREDVNPDQIAAITFSEKAAAEMKGRIIEKLGEPENRGIREIHLEKMYTAPISTIHSFCSRILRENPFQAGVPANFGILEGIEKKLLLKQTIKNTLQDIATNTNDRHRNELKCCLESFLDGEKLVDILTSMVDKRDVIQHLLETVYSDSSIQRLPNEWEAACQDCLPSETEVAEFIGCLNAVRQITDGKNKCRVECLTAELESLQDFNACSPEVLNRLKEIANLITTGGNQIATRDFIGRKKDTTDYQEKIDFLVSVATKVKDAPIIDCNDVHTDDFLLLSMTRALITLYNRVLQEYQIAKLSQSKLDFADLQIKTRDLLKNNERIRQKILNQYKFFMIDEFQDTNELQYELVMLLTDELKSANLFIVGDPKQSIYGFRDADVRVFEKTKQKINENDGMDIQLSENFRSLQNCVGFANYFFKRLMGDGSENEFEVGYQPLNVARSDNAEGVVEIILGQKDSETANEFTLIAQHIKNMVKASERETEANTNRKDSSENINFGDIAILIRARSHLPKIEHALHTAGIPYLTSGGIGFYQRQEIYDIWNYLNFLNAPDKNDSSLIGILRGPAFGISDNEIFEISLQREDNFWHKTLEYPRKTDHLTAAIAILNKHLMIAYRLPVNQLILTIVNETGMIGTLKTGRKGEQRWANYQKLLDIARNFDADENKKTLSDFIEYLNILITDEPTEGDAPIEEESDSVKIMTIHAAKGKEYPVVILPCLNRRGQYAQAPFIDEKLGIGFNPLMPNQDYNQSAPEIVSMMKNAASAKDEAEKKRILYVATTRAEDRLILTGTLKDNGKAENTLKLFTETLEISEEDVFKVITDELYVYFDNEVIEQGFQLKIPIIKQLEGSADDDSNFDNTPEIGLPERPFDPLMPSDINSSFTVEELANFARCPLRYQLENVLRIPPLDEGVIQENNSDLDSAIHRILSRIKSRLDPVEIDNRIESVLENYPELTSQDAQNRIRNHVNNYIHFDLMQTALSSDDSSINQQIYARINGHIITGRLDRLFKDGLGNWHIINFKTYDLQDIASCKPEMQLYAILFFKIYPSETKVTITFFFTEQNEYQQVYFNRTDMQEILDMWQEQIIFLQKENKNKNIEHCYICPFADSQDQCIVNDP